MFYVILLHVVMSHDGSRCYCCCTATDDDSENEDDDDDDSDLGITSDDVRMAASICTGIDMFRCHLVCLVVLN